MPKSSYFYQKEAQSRPDKYSALRTEIIEAFADNRSRYGYRRLHAVIKSKGKIISEKVVRRIMGEEKLVVPCRKKRKYSSYKGEISPAVENVVARDFHDIVACSAIYGVVTAATLNNIGTVVAD